jgi:hypothetical protein
LLAEMSRQVAPRPFPHLVHAIVTGLPGPARFDDVVDALGAILDVSDEPPAHARGEDGAAQTREVADPAPADRHCTGAPSWRGWGGDPRLPPRQPRPCPQPARRRRAGMIGLFPITETASVTDLAGARHDRPRLRELWGPAARRQWIAASSDHAPPGDQPAQVRASGWRGACGRTDGHEARLTASQEFFRDELRSRWPRRRRSTAGGVRGGPARSGGARLLEERLAADATLRQEVEDLRSCTRRWPTRGV